MRITGNEMREYTRDYQRLIDKYKREGINVHTRKKIANDMGLSIPQADRYKRISLLISEIQELIFAEVIGMSSSDPIASHSVTEQYEIYSILQGAIQENYRLVRQCVAQIVNEYRMGKRDWCEIKDSCSIYASKSHPGPGRQHSEIQTCTSVEFSLVSIKNMGGTEFVLWFARFLEKTGYNRVEVLDGSHDEGADIIAQKDGINYCFQCKNQKKPVGTSAFREVYYGKPDNCNIPVVVATGSIQKTAMRSGAKRGILSWDGKYLARLIQKTQQNEK